MCRHVCILQTQWNNSKKSRRTQERKVTTRKYWFLSEPVRHIWPIASDLMASSKKKKKAVYSSWVSVVVASSCFTCSSSSLSWHNWVIFACSINMTEEPQIIIYSWISILSKKFRDLPTDNSWLFAVSARFISLGRFFKD